MAWLGGSMTTASCKTTDSCATAPAIGRDPAVSRAAPGSVLGRRDDPDPRGISKPPQPTRELDDPDKGPNDHDDCDCRYHPSLSKRVHLKCNIRGLSIGGERQATRMPGV